MPKITIAENDGMMSSQDDTGQPRREGSCVRVRKLCLRKAVRRSCSGLVPFETFPFPVLDAALLDALKPEYETLQLWE